MLDELAIISTNYQLSIFTELNQSNILWWQVIVNNIGNIQKISGRLKWVIICIWMSPTSQAAIKQDQERMTGYAADNPRDLEKEIEGRCPRTNLMS